MEEVKRCEACGGKYTEKECPACRAKKAGRRKK